jgi:hypothetical protein
MADILGSFLLLNLSGERVLYPRNLKRVGEVQGLTLFTRRGQCSGVELFGVVRWATQMIRACNGAPIPFGIGRLGR